MYKEIDTWSLRAVPLQIKCCGHDIGSATGFFWKTGLRVFLVTNWHVLSGRHPGNSVILHSSGAAIPDEIVYPRFADRSALDEVIFTSVRLTDGGDCNFWLQHPVYGAKVDVAVVEVPWLQKCDAPEGGTLSHVYPVTSIGSLVDPAPYAALPRWHAARRDMGDDLFVLGFPLGLRPTRHFPIWKRASVASEMDVPYEGKPAFLIDTATREGMSGSPVVHIDRSGPMDHFGRFQPGRNISFVGAYSGRHIGETTMEAQLGIVWREELIPEIILGGQPGSPDLTKLP